MKIYLFSVHFKNVDLLKIQYESIQKYKNNNDINYIVIISATNITEQNNLINFCLKKNIKFFFDKEFVKNYVNTNINSHPFTLNYFIPKLGLNYNDICLLLDSDVFFINDIDKVDNLYNKDRYIYYNDKGIGTYCLPRIYPCFIMAPYKIFLQCDFTIFERRTQKKLFFGDVGTKLLNIDFFKSPCNLSFRLICKFKNLLKWGEADTDILEYSTIMIGNDFMVHFTGASWGNRTPTYNDFKYICEKAETIVKTDTLSNYKLILS